MAGQEPILNSHDCGFEAAKVIMAACGGDYLKAKQSIDKILTSDSQCLSENSRKAFYYGLVTGAKEIADKQPPEPRTDEHGYFTPEQHYTKGQQLIEALELAEAKPHLRFYPSQKLPLVLKKPDFEMLRYLFPKDTEQHAAELIGEGVKVLAGALKNQPEAPFFKAYKQAFSNSNDKEVRQ